MNHTSSIAWAGDDWCWVALAAAAVLLPLAWLSLRSAGRATRTVAVSLALRLLGIALLLLCLLDPQLVTPRAKPGANLFAVLADNSQSLQISDMGQKVSRGQQVKDALTGDGSRWLATLAEDFQVRAYAFDRDLRRIRDFSELDFQGESTALGGALASLRQRMAGQPLAGVLLLTDGNATDLPKGLVDTAQLPPIYPVVIGSADGLQDVRLSRADIRETAFDDAPVSLHAEVAGLGATGRALTVAVRPLNAPPLKADEAETSPPPQIVRLNNDTDPVAVQFNWKPRGSGVQFFEVGVTPGGSPPMAEATQLNNRRMAVVDRGRPAYRILYVGGKPGWEFKFFNRALGDDPQLQLVGLIRVAPREPKFSFIGRTGETSNPLYTGFGQPDDTQAYDQPVLERTNTRDEKELASGFPHSAEELFSYDAIVLDVESAFFTSDQLLLLRRFAAERGGGILMLGGVNSLEDGDWANTPLASALPVYLDRKPTALPQGKLTWNLTREGWVEPWTRVRAVEADEAARLKTMPQLEVVNPLASIKPGASEMAYVTDEAGTKFPALVSQNFGAGRVACLAVGDLWRWGMHSEGEQADLAKFWRQLSRWLVTDDPQQVELREEPAAEGGGVTFAIKARDKEYKPIETGTARITIKRIDTDPAPSPKTATGSSPAPVFTEITMPAEPVADAPGQFAADFAPRAAGAYLADAVVTDQDGKVLGHAQAGWVNDPDASEFDQLAPNRKLLEDLARRTGGEVVDLAKLSSFPSILAHKPAPISETESRPLWNQSWVFLAVLGCFLSEWIWRRWRGLP